MSLAALLGVILRPVLGLAANPLAWRPGTGRAQDRLASFRYAFAGLAFLVRNEANMRIHLLIGALVIVCGVWLNVDLGGWRWLVLAMALVPMAEALNTGVEQACNATSREFRSEIKAAKDVAAAGVLIAAIAAALIGASVLGPALLARPASSSMCTGAR